MSSTNQSPPPHLIPEDDTSKVKDSKTEPETKSHGEAQPDQAQQQLALPSTETTDTAQQLPLSDPDDVKHTIRFDDLGPVVVNKDGTLSRIHNWAQMADAERERTVRVLGKRNMLRKEAIMKSDPATG